MAPEAPADLVVHDLYLDGELRSRVEFVETSNPGAARLRVGWDYLEQPAGYFPVGGGVVYVRDTPEYTTVGPIAGTVRQIGPDRYEVRDVGPPGGVMVVLLLPPGDTLADPAPRPVAAKAFRGRLAAYWRLRGDADDQASVRWTLARLETELREAVRALNAVAAPPTGEPARPGERGVAMEHEAALRDGALGGGGGSELVGTVSGDRIAVIGGDNPGTINMGPVTINNAPAEGDADVIRFFAQCFDRPAFQDPITAQRSIDDLDQALEDTLTALSTGGLRSRDGVLLSQGRGKVYLRTPAWRAQMDEIALGLREMRQMLGAARADGTAQRIEEGGAVRYRLDDGALAHRLDGRRRDVARAFAAVCREADVAPPFFPDQ
jgi:hypothetical protein